MKLLTVAIPCYNSESYMEHCINTCLRAGRKWKSSLWMTDPPKTGQERLLTVMPGNIPLSAVPSTRKTAGMGEAVNTGLKKCHRHFSFKVVDSDDWVNEEAYVQVLDTLRRFVYGGETLDMLVTNFVYEKEGARRKKVMKYHTAFPKDKVFGWNDVKFFMTGQYILMHSVIYRTGLLIQCGLELPKHDLLCG